MSAASDPSATPTAPTASATATTADALLRAAPLPALEARILLAHALGWRRTELITRGDEPLGQALVAHYRSLEARRMIGEPIAQIVGAREFYGLEFEVTPHVLIPRPETELLVETALAALVPLANPRVLDLGTGSGAIAVAIASAQPDARVWALDRSAEALAVATRNAARLLDARRPGGPVTLLQSDWYA
ncbi:MAG TPA: HemK/PrmC family methyltransferase, partial [Trinickia sp.]|nr:HemK/PrmC family methyltransferase [Trinickia sp.]